MGASTSKKKGDSDNDSSHSNEQSVCNDNDERTAEEISTRNMTSSGARGGGDSDNEGSPNGEVGEHVENSVRESDSDGDSSDEYYSASGSDVYYTASDGEGNSKILNQISLPETTDLEWKRPTRKIKNRRKRRIKRKQSNKIATPKEINGCEQEDTLPASLIGNYRLRKRKHSINHDGESCDMENPVRKKIRKPKRGSGYPTSDLVDEDLPSSSGCRGSLEDCQDFREKLIKRLEKREDGKTTIKKRSEDDPKRYLEYNKESETFSVDGIPVTLDRNCLICSTCHQKFDGIHRGNTKISQNAEMFNLEFKITTHVVGKHLGGFKCTVCRQGLSSYCNWTQHMQLHTHIECDVCGKKVTSTKALKNHKLKHMNDEEKIQVGLTKTPTTTHPCTQCSKVFDSAQNLKQHVRLVHSKRIKVKCPKCKITMFKENYRKHCRKACSNDVKRLQCPLCIDTLKSDSCLQQHLQNVHTPNRKNEVEDGKYYCEWCRKMYTKRKALTQHRNICESKSKNSAFWKVI